MYTGLFDKHIDKVRTFQVLKGRIAIKRTLVCTYARTKELLPHKYICMCTHKRVTLTEFFSTLAYFIYHYFRLSYISLHNHDSPSNSLIGLIFLTGSQRVNENLLCTQNMSTCVDRSLYTTTCILVWTGPPTPQHAYLCGQVPLHHNMYVYLCRQVPLHHNMYVYLCRQVPLHHNMYTSADRSLYTTCILVWTGPSTPQHVY